MNGPEIAQQAKEQLAVLTGFKAETISSLYRDDTGWHINVEVVELRRTPDSSDILATYETLMDDTGNILSYRRSRRYYRGQTDQ